MSDQTTPKVGQLLDGSEGRDAVHFALAPVEAAARLAPGQRVRLCDGGCDRAEPAAADAVGIIDPFLRAPVEPGQRCWLFLLPGTITGLRHVWTHPAFGEPPDAGRVAAAKRWLADFAARCGETCVNYDTAADRAAQRWEPITYEDVVRAGHNYVAAGEYFVQHGAEVARDLFHEDAGLCAEFWRHWEIVTGCRVPSGGRSEPPFSCSC